MQSSEARRKRRLTYIIIIIAMSIWGLTDVRRRASLEHTHRTDITVFTTAGAAFFDDRDPYAVKSPRGWQYNYPPLFAIAFAPLSKLQTTTAAIIWFGINIAMGFGCYFEARKLTALLGAELAPRGPRPAWLWIAPAVALLFPTLNCLQRGQVGVLLVYLLMLGLRITVQKPNATGAFLGGLVVALAAVIKLFPILPACFLLGQLGTLLLTRRGGERALSRVAGAGAGLVAGLVLFLFVVPAVFTGWDANLGHLDRWMDQVVLNRGDLASDTGFNIHSVRNQSLKNAAYLLSTGDEPSPEAGGEVFERMVLIVRAAMFVLLVGTWLAGRWKYTALGLVACFGLACQLTLMISPLSWAHYFTIELPALLFVPMWFWAGGQVRAAKVIAIVPAVLSLLHYTAMPLTGPVGLLGLGTATWFTAVCLLGLAVDRASGSGPP